MSESVYEIRDTSNDEMYFPLGIFRTLDEAKAALKKLGDGPVTETGENEGFEQITLVKRTFGWFGHGIEMLKCDRERVYDEVKDAFIWQDQRGD